MSAPEGMSLIGGSGTSKPITGQLGLWMCTVPNPPFFRSSPSRPDSPKIPQQQDAEPSFGNPS
jgi:hypothetical protein